MPINLTSRQVRTIEWLLDHAGPCTVSEMADELRLSPRMVRSDLDRIERFLATRNVSVNRRRGLGVWLEGEPAAIDSVRNSFSTLKDDEAVRVFSPEVRTHLGIFALLETAPDWLTVEEMRQRLEVSVASARRDLGRVESWLSERGLFLARQPGVGLRVVGSELVIRQALVKLLLEIVPPEILSEADAGLRWWRAPGISAGIRDFLSHVPLSACHSIVQANETLSHQASQGHPWLAADLAVMVYRIRRGRSLELDAGTLRSLRDHPVWETAELVAHEMAMLTHQPLGDHEVGGLTQHLLGLVELSSDPANKARADDPLVDDAIDLAASELHPGLREEDELRRSLADHIERLRVRLRYGLPVHNPLLTEVENRYPEVHALGRRIADLIGEKMAVTVSEDEAGFVTMYLSGALERLRLRPRSRAVVMCPGGVATAWILVSRIQAEFPELDIVEVVSVGSLDPDAASRADVIISTVEVGEDTANVPVVVVGALLPDEDIRRVSRAL